MPSTREDRRVDRLERLVRRQGLALGIAIGALAFGIMAGVAGSTEPVRMSIPGSTVMGIAIEGDVIYRVRADGLVEQVTIGTRRAALKELQFFDRRRDIPGIEWEPLDLTK